MRRRRCPNATPRSNYRTAQWVPGVDSRRRLPHLRHLPKPTSRRDRSMDAGDLPALIEAAWERPDGLPPPPGGEARAAVEAALDGLDRGHFRVAEKRDGTWVTQQWLKKAVLLSFRLNDAAPIRGGGDFGAR